MSSKRRDSFSEAIVGIFMLAVLALLVYFTIVISGVDMLGGRSSNVFVIGVGSEPMVTLPKGNGVKLSIIEEKKQRESKA